MYSNAILFGWGSHDQAEMWNLDHSTMHGVEYDNPGYYANDVVLEQVRRRNLGLLVISHDAALVARLCGRTIDLAAA